MPRLRALAALAVWSSLVAGTLACGGRGTGPASAPPPTPEAATKFADAADVELLARANEVSRAQWVAANFITGRHRSALGRAPIRTTSPARCVWRRRRRGSISCSSIADVARRLKLLKLASIPLPAPSDPARQTELTQIAAGLEGEYGRGKYCPAGQRLPRHQRAQQHPREEPRPERAARGVAGMARHRAADEGQIRALRRRSATRARASSATRTSARCGGRTTTCRPTTSPPSSIGCGRRSSRSTTRCTRTCARRC